MIEAKQVWSFRELGSTLSEDDRCGTEITIGITLTKKAFSENRELLTKCFTKKFKKKIIKTLVWTLLLYDC
jgi:hypothetical protein